MSTNKPIPETEKQNNNSTGQKNHPVQYPKSYLDIKRDLFFDHHNNQTLPHEVSPFRPQPAPAIPKPAEQPEFAIANLKNVLDELLHVKALLKQDEQPDRKHKHTITPKITASEQMMVSQPLADIKTDVTDHLKDALKELHGLVSKEVPSIPAAIPTIEETPAPVLAQATEPTKVQPEVSCTTELQEAPAQIAIDTPVAPGPIVDENAKATLPEESASLDGPANQPVTEASTALPAPSQAKKKRQKKKEVQKETELKTPTILYGPEKGPKPEQSPPEESGTALTSPLAGTIPPMYIVMITPEMAPIAKVGGLSDVVYGLSRELQKSGNTVEIILPKYNSMRYDKIEDLAQSYNDLWVPWFGGSIHCTVWTGTTEGLTCLFIEPNSKDNFFNRNTIYGCNDDIMRFVFFCKASMEYLFKSGKRPEVIHCHDWPTGLIPVLLFEIYQHSGMGHCRVCYTIHNFKHQGTVGDGALHATGLGRPEYYYNYDKLRDNGNPRVLNLMKGGIVYANFTSTVSPHYAWDARFGGQGFGLEPTINTHHLKYGGVVNGIDYDYWNPETDKHIPSHFSVATIEKKYGNKRALRQRLWLADSAKPIIAFVGRLDPQKGLELVKRAIYYAIGNNAQFVLLGSSPDNRINGDFWGLKRHLNNNPDCHLEIGFNEELAHLIYAGADMMIVPSIFEPCGLTQLVSLRYGTVPIVRNTGGLADTVFDKDFSDKPLKQRNGFVFNDATHGGVDWALNRAIGLYYLFPEDFRTLMVQGMNTDCSWKEPTGHYLNIYNFIREK